MGVLEYRVHVSKPDEAWEIIGTSISFLINGVATAQRGDMICEINQLVGEKLV